MLEMELSGHYFETKIISCAGMAYEFSCTSTDTSFIYDCATMHSLDHVLIAFDIFVNWLQINNLNLLELIFIANKLILHLIMQLSLLILYSFILVCNTIKTHRYIGQRVQQAIAIELHEYRYVIKTYTNKWIHNLHGYSIHSYLIHNIKTVKNRDETKMEENDTDVNSIIIIKLMHNQLFSILLEYYIMCLRILVYGNSFPIYITKNKCMNNNNIIIKKNINKTLQKIMDYLHNGCHNIFALLRMNCINILIIFIEFSNTEAIWCLIIMGEYSVMCCIPVIVFDVSGDVKIVLLQKTTKKN